MANLNLAQVIGYLGDDCTRANKGITTLSNGDTKYTFSIATSDKWKDNETTYLFDREPGSCQSIAC